MTPPCLLFSVLVRTASRHSTPVRWWDKHALLALLPGASLMPSVRRAARRWGSRRRGLDVCGGGRLSLKDLCLCGPSSSQSGAANRGTHGTEWVGLLLSIRRKEWWVWKDGKPVCGGRGRVGMAAVVHEDVW